MNNTYKIFTILFLALLIVSCDEDDSNTGNEGELLTGETQNLGDGTTHSWIRLSSDGEPEALGISIETSALDNLGEQDFNLKLGVPGDGMSEMLGLHSIELDWAHLGHAPDPIYTLPHFDMHFYLIDEQTRQEIDPMGQFTPPDTNYVPEGYQVAPELVPMMGAHGVNMNSGEFNGETFTYTYIYGYYKGKQAFYEPMITIDFLKSNPDVSVDLAIPAKYSYNGYIPQTMNIRYDSDSESVIIELTDLMLVVAE